MSGINDVLKWVLKKWVCRSQHRCVWCVYVWLFVSCMLFSSLQKNMKCYFAL